MSTREKKKVQYLYKKLRENEKDPSVQLIYEDILSFINEYEK
jgi:hypothetical protein